MADVNINANVKSNVGAVGKSAASAAGEFRVMGVSINSVKAGIKSLGAMAKASFATMKAAIISTGIGALLIAVVSLISYFKNTQKGAEMLERAMAGMGATIDVITDRLSSVGEALSLVFSGEWKKAGEALKGTFSGITEEIVKETNAAMRLKGVMQDIRREEMEFSKVQAQNRQDVAKARLLAMDESKTQEERLEAINSVMEKELAMTADMLEMQKRKVKAAKESLGLGNSMIEDEEKLMALEVELIDMTTKSTMTQKRLMLEVETLTNEMVAKKKAANKKAADDEKKRIKSQKLTDKAMTLWQLERIEGETDEALKIRMKAAEEEQKLAIASAKILAGLSKENMLAEIDNLKDRALKKLEIEHKAKLEELKDHDNFAKLKIELDKKYARDRENVTDTTAMSLKQLSENEVKWADMTASQKMDIASNTAGNLAKVLGEETAAGKAMAITQATIDTYKGAQAAFSSLAGIPVVGPVLGGIAAAAAIASGIANVKAIASTGDGGGGGGGISAGGSGGGASPNVPAPQMMSGEFELGGGIKPEPVKAFVVTDEMSNSQNQLANIRRRATI